jgi:hypothetical protein
VVVAAAAAAWASWTSTNGLAHELGEKSQRVGGDRGGGAAGGDRDLELLVLATEVVPLSSAEQRHYSRRY